MKRNEVNREQLSPMMKQYMEIKDKYEDMILLFRLGDFYEMFFEDGINVSHELELVLTGKNAGLDEKIPMCGIPYHSINPYIEKLVDKGYKVAICEQVEDPKDSKGVVKREVVSVVSKGMIMNTESLDEKSNNYIGSVIDFTHAYSLTYADLSTGEIYTKLINYTESDLVNEIISLSLNEVVFDSKTSVKVKSIIENNYHITSTVLSSYEEIISYRDLYNEITDFRHLESIKQLIYYFNENQKRSLSHLQKIVIKENSNYLKMDIHTKRGLELVENTRHKNRNFTLLWLLDKTKTAMGSRMLKSFIENPLVSKDEINKRHDMVEILSNEFILKEELRELLYQIYDLERLSFKISYGNANGKDMIQLRNSLKVLPDIKKILKDLNFYHDIDTLDDVYKLLDASIYENPPMSIKEGYLIKEGYNSELDELKGIRLHGKDFLLKIEEEEKSKTGIKNLKVGFNKIFGYYIEISKGSATKVLEEFGYERKQTLANAERFITPLLKEKETLILGAEEKIIALEYELFIAIRDEVKKHIKTIQDVSKVIALVDVLQSYSKVSEENNYVRAKISSDRNVEIIEGRHPVVEKVISSYVPNDILMDDKTDIILLTGPNMAGKSTYLRQMAIIVVMNQIGCFVPCKSAVLPIFDSIFTRIGSSDDLVSGESTFMVEMNEANNAIKNATSSSLILFDELGRGTATYDGIALASSILDYIHDNIKCKMMFSTHYHELTSLENDLTNLKNMHVAAKESDGDITFLHKVKDGAVDKSYGIHVARLAKLPKSLIDKADVILKSYEKSEVKKVIQSELVFEKEKEDNVLYDEIEKIDYLNMTPLEALNTLSRIKNLYNEIKK